MPRTVFCVKLGREAEGFDEPPFPGRLGERIYENVSREAYDLWTEHATILINHYGLHPADPETRRMMRAEMEEFFFGEDAQLPEGWVPPDQAATAQKGGAPPRKK